MKVKNVVCEYDRLNGEADLWKLHGTLLDPCFIQRQLCVPPIEWLKLNSASCVYIEFKKTWKSMKNVRMRYD